MMPPIEPAPRQGPAYDPMDRIVTALQNIESFIFFVADNPQDLKYLHTHLPGILHLRKIILSQIELLIEEPYNYPHTRIVLLKSETEKVFLQLEGLVGSMHPYREEEFQNFLVELEAILCKFDDHLTP